MFLKCGDNYNSTHSLSSQTEQEIVSLQKALIQCEALIKTLQSENEYVVRQLEQARSTPTPRP